MPALKPTAFQARITWLGRVPLEDTGLQSKAAENVELDMGGVIGERHSGLTRLSCVRVVSQHARDTVIANVRQFAIMSREEMDEIAAAMGTGELNPEWLGISLVIEGIPDFTHVPPSSRLQAANGTTLVIDMENRPCILPGKEIEQERPGAGKKFKPASANRRGVTAWVERPGQLSLGDILTLHIPDQRPWSLTETARGLKT